jgi:hypothetical protein
MTSYGRIVIGYLRHEPERMSNVAVSIDDNKYSRRILDGLHNPRHLPVPVYDAYYEADDGVVLIHWIHHGGSRP